jgi:hypothetical protein
MKQVALTDFETYMETSLDTLSNVTTVGALNSGSITSGFGSIDNGSSAITTTGTITYGSLSDGSITITGFVDEDDMSSNSATLIPTQQSVEARIQAVNATANNVTGLNATGAELNTVADFSAVSVDTSTAIASNDAILMFDNGNEIGYRDVDLLDTYFSATTKTLTNKTLTSPIVSGLQLSDSGFSVEGSSADANETTVSFTNPTADRTITFPNATGNVAVFATAPTTAISDGSAGQFLKTDGSGTLSFAAAGAALYAANEDSPSAQPSATGANAIAIGDSAVSSGNSKSTAVGANAKSVGNQSVALGNSYASGTMSFAAAINSNLDSYGAQASNAIALSYLATATANYSVAIGYTAKAVGTKSVSLGNSYASGTDSFAAAIASNSSSYGATGANSIAIGKQAKATSTESLAIGAYAQATANYTVSVGYSNTCSAASAVSIGVGNINTGAESYTFGNSNRTTVTSAVAIGTRAKSEVQGKIAYASGRFSTEGDAQAGQYILRSDTTDATAEALTTTNNTASANNQIILPNESAMTFTGTVVVREDASDGDDYAGWEIKGVIMRQGQASDTALGVGIVNSLYHTSGLANAAVALSADTTNGGLKIQVTGIASTNLNWVATVHTSEVVNA